MGIMFIGGPGGCTLTGNDANLYNDAYADAKAQGHSNEEAHRIAMAKLPKRRK